MSTDNYHEVDHRGSRTGQSTIGVVYACVSYVLWGGLPLFFIVYTGIHQMDLLVWRIIFSLVVCLVVVAFTCGFPALRQAMANRRDHLILGIAGILISINWGTYIIAATTGRVLEASLGYFINPLATIVLGIVVLRERLRPVQNIAVGITAVAVVVLTVDYGSLPWVSLVLAGSFALYGLLKNKVGPRVGAVTGLTVETIWLSVPALAWVILAGFGRAFDGEGIGVFSTLEPWKAWLLPAVGVITVAPLLFFAGAASRLPLSTLGMFQYFAPIAQFVLGYFVFGEHMSAGRWWGFALVWVAVIMLIWDGLRTNMRQPRSQEVFAEATRTGSIPVVDVAATSSFSAYPTEDDTTGR